jgi:DNA-binding transcriptional regulator YiaG
MSHVWKHKGEKERAPLRYTQSGLDDIYLLSGYEVERTNYGDGIAIKDADALHQAIGFHLASQKRALSGKELRYLRKHMDLTQAELGSILGLSSQQVARWEKGECDISGPADRLVRALFIQFAGRSLDLQVLAKALENMNAPLHEKSYFENTRNGWRARKAA